MCCESKALNLCLKLYRTAFLLHIGPQDLIPLRFIYVVLYTCGITEAQGYEEDI